MSTTKGSYYTGPWIEWKDTGDVTRGVRLTMDPTTGSLVLSAFTIFLTLVGTRFWVLLSLFIHQLNHKHGPQLAIHNQVQVVIRNTGTGLGTFKALMRIAFAWRRHGRKLKYTLRIFLLSIVSLLVPAAWTVLALTSSLWLRQGGVALVINPKCGLWDINPNATAAEAFEVHASNGLNHTYGRASRHARECYDKHWATNKNSDGLELSDDVNSRDPGCTLFYNTQINWTESHNEPCFFEDESLCVGDSPAYTMDSGYIDSDLDLGFNSRPEDRVFMRFLTTCAPVNMERRLITIRNETENIYFTVGDEREILQSFSITHDPNRKTVFDAWGFTVDIKEEEDILQLFPSKVKPGFVGDIGVTFIINRGASFGHEVDDPVFGAHQEINVESIRGRISEQLYGPDKNITSIACVERFQHCFPQRDGSKQCGPFTGHGFSGNRSAYDFPGLLPDPSKKLDLKLTRNQELTLLVYSVVKKYASIFNPVLVEGGRALQLTQTAFTAHNTFVPKDQWKREVSKWFEVALASLQVGFVRHSTGPVSTKGLIDYAEDKESGIRGYEKAYMCNSVKVVRPQLALTINAAVALGIIFLGVGVLVLSVANEAIFRLLAKKFPALYRRFVIYTSDYNLQLIRLANEANGTGEWDRCTEKVPVTKKIEKVGVVLDIFGAKNDHPILQTPQSWAEHAAVDAGYDQSYVSQAEIPLQNKEELNRTPPPEQRQIYYEHEVSRF